MITSTPAMALFLRRGGQTKSICFYARWVDTTVLGFCDHDRDISFGGVNYLAASGIWGSDVQTPSDSSPGTAEVRGMLRSPAITDADLRAGKWDHAYCELFLVNYEDLTMGRVLIRAGWLGEVSTGLFGYAAECRGLGQALSRVIGELDSPQCRADLFDSRCTVNPAGFTVTGTLTGVNADGLTFYDTARTESGPTGGVAITNITNANPGVVTVASANAFYQYQPITMSGIVGPSALNTDTIVRNPSGFTFQLPIDTSSTGSYPPYVSGGTVTPLGASSGYFTGGKFTLTSGVNSGQSIEVKNYNVGQWIVQLPFPNGLCAAGDTYTMTAGCDKSLTTCKVRFNNLLNMRAEPYLPGLDKMLLVGRHN